MSYKVKQIKEVENEAVGLSCVGVDCKGKANLPFPSLFMIEGDSLPSHVMCPTCFLRRLIYSAVIVMKQS